jgi:hypothetical protein
MKRWLHVCCLALGCSLQALPAAAQQPLQLPGQGRLGQYSQPGGDRAVVPPILNMNRGGNPAINYFGIVQPQIDASRNLQQLQQQFQQLDGTSTLTQGAYTAATAPGTSMLTTGHPVAFMNYAAYFPLLARGAGGGGMMRGNTGALGGVGLAGTPFGGAPGGIFGGSGNIAIGVGIGGRR